MIDFKQLACLNRDELLENVVPFWLTHSQDERYGGYFTCLDRGGDVYDTDKFVWLQGRQVWLFSMLYNQVEKRPEWLECAVQGAEFLRKHGHDGNYNWYFSLTREGRPLVAPYNIFSYTFATMAFAQAALATGSAQYAEIAKRPFARILEKRDNPKGPWCKTVPGTRDLKDFALPMILCNMALEAEQMIDPALLDATIRDCIHQVMEVFYRGELGLIVENVTEDGRLSVPDGALSRRGAWESRRDINIGKLFVCLDVFQESGLISYHFKEGMLNILLKPYEGKADISGSVVLATLQSMAGGHEWGKDLCKRNWIF